MARSKTRYLITALLGAMAVGGTTVAVYSQGRPPMRYHDATEAAPIRTVAATRNAGTNRVSWRVSGDRRIVTSNGLPDHLVGSFPNSGNPNRISEQRISLSMPRNPRMASRPTSVNGWIFGISITGVPFDPVAAEYWHGDRNSGWNYDALGGAVALGLDANYAHVQPTGAYHYHGVPFGLLELARYTASAHSPLVGYAADGYPIYALTGVVNGQVTQMTSSYRLKAGRRPGGRGPGGEYDGAFVEDWEYVAGSGNLDQCNGAMTVSEEYPNGTYAYFLTEEFPAVPRCFSGVPSREFQLRRP